MFLNEKGWLYLKIDLQSKLVLDDSLYKETDISFAEYFDKYLSSDILEISDKNYNYDNIWDLLISHNQSEVRVFNNNKEKLSYNFSINMFDSEQNIVYLHIYKSYLMQDIESLKYKDFLTGLYNRAYIISTIETILNNETAGNKSIILIDLDGFKKINDNLGHSIGDNCLRKIAYKLNQICAGKLVGRYGGDEFIVFLENTNYDEIRRLCNLITDINFSIRKDGKKISVTCSCGVAISDSPKTSFRLLFDDADASLYQAKKKGKNISILLGRDISNTSKVLEDDRHQNNFYLFDDEIAKTRSFISFIAIAIIIILVIAIIIFGNVFKDRIKSQSMERANSTLIEISTQITTNINAQMAGWKSNLQVVSSLINTLPMDENYRENVSDILLDITIDTVFQDVCVLLEDGNLYGNLDYYNIASEQLAKEIIINRNTFLGSLYIYEIGEKIVFGVPCDGIDNPYHPNFVIRGIVGMFDINDFRKILDVSSFENQTFINCILKDGTRVVSSSNIDMEQTVYNTLFKIKKGTSFEEYKRTEKDIYEGRAGVVEFESDGVYYLTYYAPLGGEYNVDVIGDWRCLIYVPTEKAYGPYLINLQQILRINYILIGCIAIIMVIAISIVNHLVVKNKFLLYQDPLTNGINRERIIIDGNKLLKKYNNYAAIYVNINKFRLVNETIGKSQADEVLIDVYNILESELTKFELLSRVFADEFVLLVRCFEDNEKLIEKINSVNLKIVNKIKETYNVEINLVFGVYMIEPTENSFSKCIDNAKFAAREGTRDKHISFYNNDMKVSEKEEMDLEQKAEIALIEKQFKLYLQPKRNIQTNKWQGAEALVRWKDPSKGLISPGQFIPLFEKNGFIAKLDLYIFEEVCQFIRQSLDNKEELDRISVNVSRITISKINFLQQYVDIMRKYSIPPRYIEFEITENQFIDSISKFNSTICDMHNIDAFVAMDDFGSGNTSLNLLSQCDFDTIKLDRIFFNTPEGFSDKAKKIVQIVINMCHDLGKTVVAEGVEDEATVNFLKENHCDIIQGYYYAKPMPAVQYFKFIKKD